jgi:acylpyruvate hydrolase
VRLATLRTPGGTHAARVDGDTAVELDEPDVGALLARHDWRDYAADAAGPRHLFAEAHLAPVVPRPGKIFCVGLNYRTHILEMGRELPEHPTLFAKFAEALVGPTDPIALAPESSAVDWEAELAVVIGRPARNVTVAQAMDYVAGYTILNDLSLRDQGNRSDWNVKTDFLSGKSFDTGAPMGPWIVPARQVPDVYKLSLKQWVSTKLMQDSTTAYMHFTIAEQIAYLAQKFTLRPGDVIATGSPAGNGRPLGIFLKPGQELTVEIEKVGRLHNPIVQGE